jgi:hypothetical protein
LEGFVLQSWSVLDDAFLVTPAVTLTAPSPPFKHLNHSL